MGVNRDVSGFLNDQGQRGIVLQVAAKLNGEVEFTVCDEQRGVCAPWRLFGSNQDPLCLCTMVCRQRCQWRENADVVLAGLAVWAYDIEFLRVRDCVA